MTNLYVSKQTINGSDDGLSPARRQDIIWTTDGLLLIWQLGTNFSEMWIKYDFILKKVFENYRL